jgi:hypothetical protein
MLYDIQKLQIHDQSIWYTCLISLIVMHEYGNSQNAMPLAGVKEGVVPWDIFCGRDRLARSGGVDVTLSRTAIRHGTAGCYADFRIWY